MLTLRRACNRLSGRLCLPDPAECHGAEGFRVACAGGEILASIGIREAYETGRGPVTVRGRAFIEGNEASTSAPSSSQDGVTTSTGLALFCCVRWQEHYLMPCSTQACMCAGDWADQARHAWTVSGTAYLPEILLPSDDSGQLVQSAVVHMALLARKEAMNAAESVTGPVHGWQQGPAAGMGSGRRLQSGKKLQSRAWSSRSCPTRPTRPTSW